MVKIKPSETGRWVWKCPRCAFKITAPMRLTHLITADHSMTCAGRPEDAEEMPAPMPEAWDKLQREEAS